MKSLITSIFAFLSLSLAAQTSNVRTFNNFDRISVATSLDVEYHLASTYKVEIASTDEKLLEKIITEEKNGQLKLYVASNSRIKEKLPAIKVYGPHLSEIAVSSSASFQNKEFNKSKKLSLSSSSSGTIKGSYQADNISLQASSSADIQAKIKAKDVNAKTSSSATVVLEGSADNIYVDASSSSELEGFKLSTKNAVISASSSSDVNLAVSDSLKAKASSSADIRYIGNPKTELSKSSSGSINKK